MTLRAVVTLLVILFPISEAALALAGRARSRGARRADEGSLTILWVTIAASVTAAAFSQRHFPGLVLPLTPVVRDVMVLVLLCGGLSLRWVAIAYLGRFFTVDVAIHEGHAVVEHGPYAYIRHPSYTGILLAFTGLGIYFGNWVSLLLVILPIVLAFLRRIKTEERALTHALGGAYLSYCARTSRLIPGVF